MRVESGNYNLDYNLKIYKIKIKGYIWESKLTYFKQNKLI